MTGWGPQGLRGPDGASLGVKKNPYIKRGGFGHKETCLEPNSLPFLNTIDRYYNSLN